VAGKGELLYKEEELPGSTKYGRIPEQLSNYNPRRTLLRGFST